MIRGIAQNLDKIGVGVMFMGGVGSMVLAFVVPIVCHASLATTATASIVPFVVSLGGGGALLLLKDNAVKYVKEREVQARVSKRHVQGWQEEKQL